jgi:hypothetical protein
MDPGLTIRALDPDEDYLGIEVAALDHFIESLRQVERDRFGSAALAIAS